MVASVTSQRRVFVCRKTNLIKEAVMSKEDKSGNWFKRHKLLTVILVIILIGTIAGSGSDKKSNTSTGSSEPAGSSTAPTTAALNQAVRDGQFEFTVASAPCGKPTVTDASGFITKSAQGKYCMVNVTVKNIGDKAQYFSATDQKLLNAAGQQYSADYEATSVNSDHNDSFMSQINPGNSVQGVMVFDIPKDQTPVTMELHDSSFSGGVKVTL